MAMIRLFSLSLCSSSLWSIKHKAEALVATCYSSVDSTMREDTTSAHQITATSNKTYGANWKHQKQA